MTIKTQLDFAKHGAVCMDLFRPLCHGVDGTHAGGLMASREESTLSADEQKSQEIRFVQMLVAAVKYAQEPAPITINNISASHAESQVKGHSIGPNQMQSKSSMELISDMYHAFFSSRFNRVCFFGMCGMSMYVYWSYLDHKWHMAEVQRRVDSNIVLKMSQWLFSADRMPQPASRWFPSLW